MQRSLSKGRFRATAVVGVLAVTLMICVRPASAEEFTDPARLAAAIDAAKAKALSSGITYTTGGVTVQGNAGGTVWRTVGDDGYILHAKTPAGWAMYVPNTPDTNPTDRANVNLVLAALGKKPGGLLMVGMEDEADVQINDPWRSLTGLSEATYTTDSAGRLTSVDSFGERVFEVKSWSAPLAKLPADNATLSTDDQLRMQLMLMAVMMDRTDLEKVYGDAVADPRFKSRPVPVLLETLRANGWNPQPTANGAVVQGTSSAGMRWKAVISAKGNKRNRGVSMMILTPAPLPPASITDPGETFAAIDATAWTLGILVNPIFPAPTQASVLDWITKAVKGTVESSNPLMMSVQSGGRLSAVVVPDGSGWRVNLARSVDGYCGAFVMTNAALRPTLTAPASPGEVTREGTCA